MHMLITSDSVSEEISTVAHVEGEFLRARPISAENVAGESPSPPKSRGGNDLPLVPSAVGVVTSILIPRWATPLCILVESPCSCASHSSPPLYVCVRDMTTPGTSEFLPSVWGGVAALSSTSPETTDVNSRVVRGYLLAVLRMPVATR